MKRLNTLVCTLVCIMFLTPVAEAQQQGPTQWLQVINITAKPDMVPEFEMYIKNIIGALKQTENSQQVMGLMKIRGGTANSYMFVLPYAYGVSWIPGPRCRP